MTVLVTGVFDVLHEEHIVFLKKAKALGDRLIAAIESDVRVKQIKGTTRPVHSQDVRKANLEKLNIANQVVILPEQFNTPEDRLAFLRSLKPDILAVSSHTPHLEQKQRLMQEIGGRVEVVHEHNPAVSSTLIISNGGSDPQHG